MSRELLLDKLCWPSTLTVLRLGSFCLEFVMLFEWPITKFYTDYFYSSKLPEIWLADCFGTSNEFTSKR